jgi:hypothetical protein
MYSDGSALRQLSRDECLRLMASVPVGRVIYTRRAMPAVELVNFALGLYQQKLTTARRGVDDSDRAGRMVHDGLRDRAEAHALEAAAAASTHHDHLGVG